MYFSYVHICTWTYHSWFMYLQNDYRKSIFIEDNVTTEMFITNSSNLTLSIILSKLPFIPVLPAIYLPAWVMPKWFQAFILKPEIVIRKTITLQFIASHFRFEISIWYTAYMPSLAMHKEHDYFLTPCIIWIYAYVLILIFWILNSYIIS